MGRVYGTIGLAEQSVLSSAYDKITDNTEMYPAFYQWVVRRVSQHVPRGAALIDVGCGTGGLLSYLRKAGYLHLSGADFSHGCVAKAQERLPGIEVQQHDILAGPLGRVDCAIMSEVLEHLADPVRGLRNIREMVPAGGTFVLTFPNRDGFWPWYHVGPLVRSLLSRRPWLRHWWGWFTMPYEMDRSVQPIDHAYSVPEVRRFLMATGFRVEAEYGFRFLTMLRIPGLDWTERAVAFIERTCYRAIPRRLFYRYMLICR